MHTKPWVRARAKKDYWQCLCPASGRPFCATMSKPDAWGVTQGDDKLMQNFQTGSKTTAETNLELKTKLLEAVEKAPSESSSNGQPEIEASPCLSPTVLDGVRGGYAVPAVTV